MHYRTVLAEVRGQVRHQVERSRDGALSCVSQHTHPVVADRELSSAELLRCFQLRRVSKISIRMRKIQWIPSL